MKRRVKFKIGKTGRWSKPTLNTGKGPNAVVLAEYKKRVESMKYSETLPDSRRRNAHTIMQTGYRDFNVDPKLAIELKLLEQANDRTHFTHVWHKIAMKVRDYETIYMYWSGDQFIFVKEDLRLERSYESPLYEGRNVAMWAWTCDRIKWKHVQPHPAPKSS